MHSIYTQRGRDQAANTLVDYKKNGTHDPAMVYKAGQTDPASIGKRIVFTREALGMSAADFARFLDFSTQALSNYEVGLRRPSLDQAFIIVRKTGITLDWLYFGDVSGLPMRIASKLPQATPRKVS